MFFKKYLIYLFVFLFPSLAVAGVDIRGPVVAAQIDNAGNLLFKIDSAVADLYCSNKGWMALNFFVPKDAPQFAYFYGIVMTAVSKDKDIYVANINIFNGSVPCDPSKTGYGLVLLR